MRTRVRIPLLLVLTCALRSADAPGQTTGRYTFAGYDQLMVQDDPWPRATGGGPASGWGVAAAGFNPSAIAFGQEASGAATLPWSEQHSHMSFGIRSPHGPALGFSVRGSNSDRLLLAGTLAYRPDTARALGIAVKRLSGASSRELWFFDFGFRWEQILPRLTWRTRESTLRPFGLARWQPGMTIGLAVLNMSGELPSRAAVDPLAVAVGLSYKPVISHALCLSLNASHRWLEHPTPESHGFWTEPPVGGGTSAVGLGAELYQAVELGISLQCGFGDRVPRLAWSAAAGPPYFRVIWSAGADIKDRGPFRESFKDQFMIRMYFPVEVRTRTRAQREPTSPYGYWPDR